MSSSGENKAVPDGSDPYVLAAWKAEYDTLELNPSDVHLLKHADLMVARAFLLQHKEAMGLSDRVQNLLDLVDGAIANWEMANRTGN